MLLFVGSDGGGAVISGGSGCVMLVRLLLFHYVMYILYVDVINIIHVQHP